MKRFTKAIALILALVMSLSLFVGCNDNEDLTIAIPNDAAKREQALQFLAGQGYITLKEGGKTLVDITENPHNITFVELAAEEIPDRIGEFSYAVMSAMDATNVGLNPNNALALEDAATSPYSIVLAVKSDHTDTLKVLALDAAVRNIALRDYINESYNGVLVSTVEHISGGFSAEIEDYSVLNGTRISVATTTKYMSVMEKIAESLGESGIILEIVSYPDSKSAIGAVEKNQTDALLLYHTPFLKAYNLKYYTHLVGTTNVFLEPMGLYGGTQNNLKPLS